jgi:putative membrane protein
MTLCAIFLFASSAFATTAAPSDAAIAHVAVTANQVDVEAGRLAETKARSAEVKTFAELMVKDHASVVKSASELADKLKLTPEDNDTSKALAAGGKDNVEKLSKLDGAAFDRAYVAHEVAYHQTVLDAIDKTLIPNAKNGELKGLLQSVRPVVVQHLDHAKMLEMKLGK